MRKRKGEGKLIEKGTRTIERKGESMIGDG